MFKALVFNTENDSLYNETVPRYVSYKIRMDVDRVDSTRKFKVTDRYDECVAFVASFPCHVFIIVSMYF